MNVAGAAISDKTGPGDAGDGGTADVDRVSRSLSYRLLFALSLALLPIGLLAVVLGAANLRSNRAEQERFAHRQFDAVGKTLEDIFSGDIMLLQTLLLKSLSAPELRDQCSDDLTRAVNFSADFAALMRVNARGQVLCSSASGPQPSPALVESEVRKFAGRTGFDRRIAWGSGGSALFFIVRDNTPFGDRDTIIATIAVANLQDRLSRIVVSDGGRFALRLGDQWLSGRPLANWNPEARQTATRRARDPATGQTYISVAGPLSVPTLQLAVATPVKPLGAGDVLALLIPGLMWLAALLISWLSLRRLVIRPLQTMAREVRSYGHGNYQIRLAERPSSTDEMRQFASAFDQMADEAAASRRRIGEALAAQQRLTREVHHRVKNNLQIIASLLSIQAREDSAPEVTRAYATIQMRVNALALVHRWLFEDNAGEGVDLGALARDLCGSLEYSLAAVEHVEPRIVARIDRLFVSQDAAVPLAFLVTEIVAMAARLAAANAATVAVDVDLRQAQGEGTLIIASPAFPEDDQLDTASRTAPARIVNGMVRQMRGGIRYDGKARAYAIVFPLAKPVPASDLA